MSTEFLITALVVVLIPGTGVIYTVSTGLFLGKRRCIAAAIGCTAGIIPHLSASILGLSALLHMSALAFQIVKYVGVAYLLYLAWSMWRETGALELQEKSSVKDCRQIAVKGFLINILNPKLSIFFLAFLPQFVSPESSAPHLQLFFMSVVFMLMTLGIFILYGLLADYVRKYIIHSPSITTMMQKSFAAIFAGLGLKLALSE